MMQHKTQQTIRMALSLFVILALSLSSVFAIPVTLNSSQRAINVPGYLQINTTATTPYAINAGGSINGVQLCIAGQCYGGWGAVQSPGNITGALQTNFVPSAFNASHFTPSLISTYTNGSVGINTTAPASLLHIKSASATPLTVESVGANSYINLVTSSGTAEIAASGAGVLYLGGNAAQAIYLRNSGYSNRMAVLANGYVGINTSNPYQALNVIGDVNFSSNNFVAGPGTKATGGSGAVALGEGSVASGPYGATAIGENSLASGQLGATAIGHTSTASGNQGAFAAGKFAVAAGFSASVAIGEYATSLGDNGAVAIGSYAMARGASSTAIGQYVTSHGANSIALGKGVSTASFLNNTIPNSMIVGFGATPTLFVNGSNVGAGTVTPSNYSKLQVENGKLIVLSNSNNWGQLQVANPSDAEASISISAGGSGSPGNDATYTRQWVMGINPYGVGLDRFAITNKGLTSSAPFTILDTGNVGIGTTNPTSRLHIVGGATISAGLNVTVGTVDFPDNSLASADVNFNYAGSSSKGGAATTATALAANGGNCAAGSFPLGVDASGAVESCTAISSISNLTGTITSGYVTKATGVGTIGNSIIYDSGTNVGIGGAAPAEKLAVTGNISTTTGAYFATSSGAVSVGTIASPPASTMLLVQTGASSSVNIARFFAPSLNSGSGADIYIGRSGNSGEAVAIGTVYNSPTTNSYAYFSVTGDATTSGLTVLKGGNVGIGNAAPSEKLTVTGNISSTTGAFFATSSGNVGIGTTAVPTYKLTVNGNIGASAYWFTSDAKFKTNIKPFELQSTVSKVMKLNPVTFEWKDQSQGKGTQIGLVAQDVEKVYPELVNTAADGTKSVEYANLVAPLIATAQSQQKQIDAQQKQIDVLRAEIEALKAERK